MRTFPNVFFGILLNLIVVLRAFLKQIFQYLWMRHAFERYIVQMNTVLKNIEMERNCEYFLKS